METLSIVWKHVLKSMDKYSQLWTFIPGFLEDTNAVQQANNNRITKQV
jgi:hypothetical protein